MFRYGAKIFSSSINCNILPDVLICFVNLLQYILQKIDILQFLLPFSKYFNIYRNIGFENYEKIFDRTYS